MLISPEDEQKGLFQGYEEAHYINDEALDVWETAKPKLIRHALSEFDDLKLGRIQGTGYLLHIGERPQLLVTSSHDGSGFKYANQLFDSLLGPLEITEIEVKD